MDETQQTKHLSQISGYAASLATLELGIGSLLHAFHVPFSGQLLSIHQSAVLSHASRKKHTISPLKGFYISSIVAILKSLSPAGKKLGPMLSISMQGFLFSLGSLFFGINSFGIGVGAALSSLWAFAQPFLTLILFFGEGFFQAIAFYQEKWIKNLGITDESILLALGGLVLLKMFLAISLCIWSYKTGRFFTHAQQAVLKFRPRDSHKPKLSLPQEANLTLKQETFTSLKLALKDLVNPLFLSSFTLMIVFFIFSRSEHSQTIWILLRPLAVAFLFFFFSRHPSFYRLFAPLQRYRWFRGFAKTFTMTKNKLQNEQTSVSKTNRKNS